MKGILETVMDLCALGGVSGSEDAVREYVIKRIDGKCDYSVDALGSVLAFKKGAKQANKKVLFDAHTDEVGVVATYITEDGYVRFAPVGGVNSAVLPGKRVIFPSGAVGVIEMKPIHLIKRSEEGKLPEPDKMFIDVGCDKRVDTLKLVKPGDTAYFDSDFVRLGEHRIKAKALDDRIGCAIMIDMIENGTDYDAWFSFSVQEEIGLRGATVSSYSINPDYAVALEATTASDLPGASGGKEVCRLGDGVVVSFIDGRTIYDPELYRFITKTADEKNIKWQTKTMIAGGNDAGAIQQARGGVKVAALSVPCRYIHSPSCVCDARDIEATAALARAALTAINEK